jgi:hypothetical protein
MFKVVVRIKGGLGNQLFQYAAARRLALANNAELVVDDITGFTRESKYNRKYMLDKFRIKARKATPRERLEPFERFRRGFSKFIAQQRSFHLRRYVEQESIDFDPRLLEYRVKGIAYLDGLWQSEKYFKDIEETIREDLIIKSPTDRANLEIAKQIKSCNAVAIHIRWFDKPDSKESENNIKRSYYKRAVEEIMNKITEPYYFLFSDQPDAARQMLNIPKNRITNVSHNRGDENAFADLWLMSQCKHFIIANSTFSWWGAWLSDSASKIVICPKQKSFEGKQGWGFFGLIPDMWLCL